MGSGKQMWKISFHKSPSQLLLLKKQTQAQNQQPIPIPVEFLCPLSSSMMADPVIVSSGHTFERNCVHACVSLSFNPTLPDGAAVDFSVVIPNLALKSTILSWCCQHLIDPPKPIDFYSAEQIVRKLIPKLPASELTRTPSEVSVASSDDSVTPRIGRFTPLPLTTRPSCYSSSSSNCDIEISSSNFSEEEELVVKLKSSQIHEQEEALGSLRKMTRTREETRAHLCTPRMLSALKSLISSRYSSLQVNAVAALVNLSLDKQNKVKIVRSGIVPPLIDVLRGGFQESQDHAAGALFSLSLDDQNKTAIGVLGALPPLLHSLRSESERTRHDSALALYHLSLVQSNRVKMIKLGAAHVLLGMVKSGHMLGRVMLVLCNLAASSEGRAAMLDAGAVECFLSLLSHGEFESPATQETCLAAVYGLSYGGLRFKGLAKEGGAEEILTKLLEKTESEHGRQKMKRILEVLREKHEEDEEVNWEELLNSDDDLSRTQSRASG